MIVPTITVKHNKFRRDQQNKKYITYGNRIMIRRDTDLIGKKKKNTVTRRVRRVGSNTKTETRVKETELRRRKVGRS